MRTYSPLPCPILPLSQGCTSGYASPLQHDRVDVDARLVVQRVSGALEGVAPLIGKRAPAYFYAPAPTRQTWHLGRPLVMQAPRAAAHAARTAAFLDKAARACAPSASAEYEEIFVVERVMAAKLTSAQLQDTRMQTRLFELLDKAHAQPADAQALMDYDLAESVQQAVQGLGDHSRMRPLCDNALRQFVSEQRATLLAYAQPKVVVHGDVWHDNILTDPEGRLWLIDWGLAHLGDPLEDFASPLIRAEVPLNEEESILGLAAHCLRVPEALQHRFSAIMGLLEASYYAHQASSTTPILGLPSLDVLARRLQYRSRRDLAKKTGLDLQN